MAVPGWLHLLATASLVVAGVCALTVTLDLLRGHRQRMWIMNVVWPLTALYAGPLGLWAYFTLGRAADAAKPQAGVARTPFWQSVAVGATHCGSGCTLADLIVEWTLRLAPVTLLGSAVVGGWLVDYLVAFVLGIAFQYFTIAPMRHLSVGQGIWAAVKADTLSLSAWQVGMYGFMAVALFVLFSPAALPKTGPVYWFMMQIAMLCGFLVSYPVNWWLLRSGLKEVM